MLNITDQKLISGTRWLWDESLTYDPSEYTLQIILKKSNGDAITLTASESDEGAHEIDYSATNTAQIPAGYYVYSARVIEIADTSNIIAIEEGLVEVIADPFQAGDVRTLAQKMVDKIETALIALAGNTMSSISIDGRTYTYKDENEIIKRLEYWKSQAGIKGQSKRQRILTQFTNH